MMSRVLPSCTLFFMTLMTTVRLTFRTPLKNGLAAPTSSGSSHFARVARMLSTVAALSDGLLKISHGLPPDLSRPRSRLRRS